MHSQYNQLVIRHDNQWWIWWKLEEKFLQDWQCRLCYGAALTFLPLEVGCWYLPPTWQASFNHIEPNCAFIILQSCQKRVVCLLGGNHNASMELEGSNQIPICLSRCTFDHLYIWKVHTWLKAGSWNLASNCSSLPLQLRVSKLWDSHY